CTLSPGVETPCRLPVHSRFELYFLGFGGTLRVHKQAVMATPTTLGESSGQVRDDRRDRAQGFGVAGVPQPGQVDLGEHVGTVDVPAGDERGYDHLGAVDTTKGRVHLVGVAEGRHHRCLTPLCDRLCQATQGFSTLGITRVIGSEDHRRDHSQLLGIATRSAVVHQAQTDAVPGGVPLCCAEENSEQWLKWLYPKKAWMNPNNRSKIDARPYLPRVV